MSDNPDLMSLDFIINDMESVANSLDIEAKPIDLADAIWKIYNAHAALVRNVQKLKILNRLGVPSETDK